MPVVGIPLRESVCEEAKMPWGGNKRGGGTIFAASKLREALGASWYRCERFAAVWTSIGIHNSVARRAVGTPNIRCDSPSAGVRVHLRATIGAVVVTDGDVDRRSALGTHKSDECTDFCSHSSSPPPTLVPMIVPMPAAETLVPGFRRAPPWISRPTTFPIPLALCVPLITVSRPVRGMR